jgi:ubiquinone/menaquinone biosynthesis C-methylase UbiE
VDSEGVALVVLARDEEAFLDECYRHHAPYFDFTICLVSRSKDRTQAIAKRNFDCAEIISFPGSFSLLREHANNISPCRWVLHVDADERFPTSLLLHIKNLAEKLPPSTTLGFPRINPQSFPTPWPDYQYRLMAKETRYIGKVHETPLGVKRQLPAIAENAIIHLAPPARTQAKIFRWRSLGDQYWAEVFENVRTSIPLQNTIWRLEKENMNLTKQLDATRRSVSWRISAPVRWIGSILVAEPKLKFQAIRENKQIAYIQSNPLGALHNPKVRDVFRQIIEERLNNNLLSSYYKLGESVDSYNILGHTVSREELAGKIVDFLTILPKNDPIDAARAFWNEFSFSEESNAGVPIELVSIESAYRRICQKATGVVMIQDLLTQPNLPNGTIVDVGCSSNELNMTILTQADRNEIKIEKAIGTDIVDTTMASNDPRVAFLRQPSPKTLPLETECADLAILKWTLHHMTVDEVTSIAREINRVLKQSGKAVLIEALVGQDMELYHEFLAECKQKDTWPEGPWQKLRRNITKRYFRLSLDEQKAVLALEDYYGHWLESMRTDMPLPFTYLTHDEIDHQFEVTGMNESPQLRRVFGFAPIIHQGPPSIRLVYEKQTAR